MRILTFEQDEHEFEKITEAYEYLNDPEYFKQNEKKLNKETQTWKNYIETDEKLKLKYEKWKETQIKKGKEEHLLTEEQYKSQGYVLYSINKCRQNTKNKTNYLVFERENIKKVRAVEKKITNSLIRLMLLMACLIVYSIMYKE